MQQQINLKIILLGDPGVGKSSTLWRYINPEGDYRSQSFTATLGADFLSESREHKGQTYYISIWDTAGQDSFRTMLPSYIKGAHGVVYVFDLTSRPTFEAVQGWKSFFLTHTTETGDVPAVLLGNKCDKESRAVTSEEGQNLAAEIGAKYFEASASLGTNIQEAFDALYMEVIPLHSVAEHKDTVSITTPEGDTKGRSGCC